MVPGSTTGFPGNVFRQLLTVGRELCVAQWQPSLRTLFNILLDSTVETYRNLLHEHLLVKMSSSGNNYQSVDGLEKPN